MTQTITLKNLSVNKLFTKYVSQNILGMLGISAYILADTLFISMVEGADGITALNLVLPLYNLIYAIGSMIAVGSATRFKILRARKDPDADSYFSNAVLFALLLSSIFVIAGIFIPQDILHLLGADARIIKLGTPYTRIFMVFAPFFMLNHICNSFVRNDGSPSIAMMATLSSSLFNIVMDYVLMFPCKLGMTGAALATVFSPIVGILICGFHFFSKKNTVSFCLQMPSFKRLLRSCQLGISAFVNEISAGVTTMVFNFLILSLTGNVGIAAYGIVANIAIIATSIFNGISQGSQPLLSDFYGKGDQQSVKKILRLSILSSLFAAILIIGFMNLFPEQIVWIFNSEKNAQMASYAVTGIHLYFIGFLFAGFNIVGTGYLSATEVAGWAFITSILRGFIAVPVLAFILSALFGMTGIWLTFTAAELLTASVMFIAIRKR